MYRSFPADDGHAARWKTYLPKSGGDVSNLTQPVKHTTLTGVKMYVSVRHNCGIPDGRAFSASRHAHSIIPYSPRRRNPAENRPVFGGHNVPWVGFSRRMVDVGRQDDQSD